MHRTSQNISLTEQVNHRKTESGGFLDSINRFVRIHDLMGRILIYQMGKVGSTSLESSLGSRAHHAHSLFGFHRFKYFVKDPNLFHDPKIELEVWMKSLLKRAYLRFSRRPLKIISLVREPVSRNVSAYFQELDSRIKILFPAKNDRFKTKNYINVVEEDFYNIGAHDTPLKWFDDEIKRAFGIDAFAHEFDRESGYTIIREKNIELMILKLEKLNGLEKKVSEFCGERISLKNENESGNKWYHSIYRDFKHNFQPRTEYINSLYDSKFMAHFYTDEEIAGFRKKWNKSKADLAAGLKDSVG